MSTHLFKSRAASLLFSALLVFASGQPVAQTQGLGLETRPFGGSVSPGQPAAPQAAADRRVAQSLRDARAAQRAGNPDWARAGGLAPAQVRQGEVRVEIGIDAAVAPRVEAELRRLGLRIDRSDPGRVEGSLPMSALEAVAALDGVRRIIPQLEARPMVGASDTQGILAGRAERWHNAGFDGTGVTIAVIDGFDGAAAVAALQGSGDWPPNARLTLVDMHGGGFGAFATDHGMATLEIAHDIAPGANFIAYDTRLVSQWRDAIIDAVDNRGADVISASLGAPLNGIGDGSALPGSVAEAVEYARANGVLVVNAAGNERESHWGGLWASTGIDPDGGGGPYTDSHDFGGGATVGCFGPAGTTLCYCFPSGFPIQVEMFWDDWSNVDHDYDIRLLRRQNNGNWNAVTASTFPQTGLPGETPQEFISATTAVNGGHNFCGNNSTMYGIDVVTSDPDVANGDNNLQIFSLWPLRLNVPARSLGFPADSPALVAAAAIDVSTSLQETYSSEGPILAPGGGLPLGTEPHKPDVASFANVDTESYGPGVFNGTSSATPHVAGMAALLIERNGGPGSIAVADLHAALLEIASAGSNDLGTAGDDFQHGAGRLRFQLEDALAFEDQPSDTVTNTPMSPPPSVSVRDDEGEVVAHGLVDFIDLSFGTDPSGGSAALSNGSETVIDGVAVFDAATIDTAGTGYTFEADALTLDGLPLAAPTSNAFDVIDGVVASVVFTQQPGNTTAGVAISPAITVELRNSGGQLISTDNSTQVTLSLETNPGGDTLGGTTTVTASGGVASFADISLDAAAAGYSLRATSDGGPFAVSNSFDITAAAAASISFTTQPSDTEAGQAISPAVAVSVEDAFGNAVADGTAVNIALSANPGGDTLGGTLSVNTSAGSASFADLVLDAAASGYTLQASSGAANATSDPFAITAAAADQVVFVVQPSDATAGAAISPAVEVRVEDAFGNAVADGAAVDIALGANPGSDTLGGTLSAITSGGVASFGDLTLEVAASGYTLVASSGALDATSDAFDVVAAAPDSLAFTVQPTSTVAGVAIAPAVEVSVQDAFGNAVADGTAVSIALAANPGGDVLAGTLSVNTSGGVASFADLVLDAAASGYTLQASAGAASDTSASFDVSAAAPDAVAFQVQPSDIGAGAVITPAVEVSVTDAFGNAVADGTSVSIALATNPGADALAGTLSATTSGGVASFADLSLDVAASGYTLEASAGGANATSAGFDVLPQGAASIVYLVQPGDATAGSVFAPAVQLQLLDAFGNPVADGTAVSLALDANPGGDTLGGTVATTTTGGVASFTDLSLTVAASGYTLRATSGALELESDAFDVTHAAPVQLAFSVQPVDVEVNATMAPAVEVRVEDAFGNLASSDNATEVSLALGANPGLATLTGGGPEIASGGVAVFAGISLDVIASGYVLDASAAGLAGDSSQAFDVLPQAAPRPDGIFKDGFEDPAP